jgi:TM2 domain-containing membrane protein YozV
MSETNVRAAESCPNCGQPWTSDQTFCPSCGVQRGSLSHATRPSQTTIVVNPKSAGLAVFFTFLWLGVGHLYVNRIGTGVALLVVDLLLWALAWTVVGWVLAFPIWLVLFVVTAFRVADHVRQYNQRMGVAG